MIHNLREISPSNRQEIATIAQLHRELLSCDPIAELGELFIREMCYAVPLKDGSLKVALCDVDGRPAGFVAYALRSGRFHRTVPRNYWLSASWILVVSILHDLRRLRPSLRALRAAFSHRTEQQRGQDLVGEVVAIGVRPEYLTPEFVCGTGVRVGEELIAHALVYFQRAGISKVRMPVDALNESIFPSDHHPSVRPEPYEQAEEPIGYMWVDLGYHSLASVPEVPPCWSLDSTSTESSHSALDHWEAFWEGLREQQIHRAEADDYVRRLEAALPLDPRAQVLDFGCGFGYVAMTLAPKVGEVFLWDASANIRRHARVNVANSCPNIRFLDLLDPHALTPNRRFDLILVNSVVQYMTIEEFSWQLITWRKMLAPGGRIIISDLIPPGVRPLAELAAMLVFSTRHRFLLRALREGLGELSRYSRTRAARPLLRLSHEDVLRLATAAGLTAEFLPENLTHRSRRITAVFSDMTNTGPV